MPPIAEARNIGVKVDPSALIKKMRLHQRTSVKRFGKMRHRARQNSRQDSIHIGARCNQHRRYINVLVSYGKKQRGP
jgi:hypothetical protein